MSSRTSAVGSARIEWYDGGDSDLTGLGEDIDFIVKYPAAKISEATPNGKMANLDSKARNPITSGNLILDPETPGNWGSYNGATFSTTAALSLPGWEGSEAQRVLGNDVVGIKVTPVGAQSPSLFLNFRNDGGPKTIGTDRVLNYEFWIYCPQAKQVRARVALGSAINLYDYTHDLEAGIWRKISCVDEKPTNADAYCVQLFELHATQVTYIVGVMVSQDAPSPYSRYLNPNSAQAISSNGVIVPDTANGKRYLLRTTNGVLSITEV
jgi:hypothetical protein